MTYEELAKEYAKLNARQYKHNDGIGFCTSEEEVEKAFLAGLKAKTLWHNLRENPNDLPPNNTIVLDENNDKIEYIGYGKWQVYSEYYEKNIEVDAPIAWCEQLIFDKE